jgi:hypothetical protein
MKKTKVMGPDLFRQKVEDLWAAQKAEIQELAQEQAAADIAYVEAQRAFAKAKAELDRALSRKTTAEKKLSHKRTQLGGE